MAFPLENLGYSRDEMVKRMNDIVTELGISHLMDRSIFELSGGEKQVLCLAICFVTGAPVVVLDEPTSNLDLESIQKVKKLLVMLKAAGRTIIISEHRIEYLIDLIDRVSIIDNGRIVRSLSGRQFQSIGEEERVRLGLRTFSPVRQVTVKPPGPAAVQIEIRDLALRYGKKPMVQINNLILEGGKVIALTGKNGHGKSTFMKLLTGLVKPWKEDVRINDRRMDYKKRLQQCYMVLQDVNAQLFTTSIEEELLLGSQNADPGNLLKKIGLFARKEEHPLALSGGEKQRVSLAAGIASGRDVLIADEPTSGMDFENMRIASKMLSDYAREGKVVLLISHDMELIVEAADEILYMEEGGIAWREEKSAAVLERLVECLTG